MRVCPDWEIIITDPVNLDEPPMIRQYYEWVPGEEIKHSECPLLAESRHWGVKLVGGCLVRNEKTNAK